MWPVARTLAVVLCVASSATARPHTFLGRPLDEALRLLQQDGLPIVFSSEVVSPGMRVATEPRGAVPREQLDELLAPHGLKAEPGPGRVILVVRDRQAGRRPQKVRPVAERPVPEPMNPHSATGSFVDRVTVRGTREQMDRGVSETTADSRALRLAGSPLQSDALDAIHALPRVTSVDDYHGDFSVRGSPYRQIGIVIDGVPTRWLQHLVYGRNDAGSLSMFGSDILDRATLQAGAYPRRYDDALGAQLELTLKEGSRDTVHIASMIGGMSAAVVGEGPIGSEGRGSWIAGLRNSYRSWPPRPWSAGDVGFAFADAHMKLVYDVTPAQQISVTALGGRSALDTVDEPLVGVLGNGIDRAGLVTVGWQSTVGAKTVLRQRVAFVGQDLETTFPSGLPAGLSHNDELAFRSEMLHAILGGVLEAGAALSRMSGARHYGLASDTRAEWTTRSAYVNFARALTRGLSFESGVRVSDSTLVDQHVLDPWVLGTWAFKPGWAMKASAGGSAQFAGLDDVAGPAGSRNLVPERASHVDVGIERRAPGMLWEATVFTRVEHDVLQPPLLQPRVLESVFDPSPHAYRNSLHGTSRGTELVVSRDRASGLSGWLSYTYATSRQTDAETQSWFWSDLDRRHALNAAGLFHVGRQTSLGLVLRAASGVPIPGYYAISHGVLVAGDQRNAVRLAPYVRLDARAQRTFFSSRHAVTIFGEVLNVLNHHNEGLTDGLFQPATADTIGISRPLLPRRASIGIQIDFSR